MSEPHQREFIIMIETIEHVHDPVEWFQGNVRNTDFINENGYQIFSGQDIDFMVNPQEGVAFGRVERQVSRFLGNLYMSGQAYGVEHEGQQFQLEWYPSPTAANALSEELGLTPGHDVLKFVHAPYDQIPAGDYVRHLKNHEYPQSSHGVVNFRHDRNDDHAVGVFFMPERMFETIKTWRDMKTRFGKQNLPRVFDSSTNGVLESLKLLEKNDFDIKQADDDRDFRRGYYDYAMEYVCYLLASNPTWRRGGLFKNGNYSYMEALGLVVERYQALLPKIEAAQKQKIILT